MSCELPYPANYQSIFYRTPGQLPHNQPSSRYSTVFQATVPSRPSNQSIIYRTSSPEGSDSELEASESNLAHASLSLSASVVIFCKRSKIRLRYEDQRSDYGIKIKDQVTSLPYELSSLPITGSFVLLFSPPPHLSIPHIPSLFYHPWLEHQFARGARRGVEKG